jgi:hypothetical protein
MAQKATLIFFLYLLPAICCSQQTNHAVVIGIDAYRYWTSPAKLKENIDSALSVLRTNKEFNFRVVKAINAEATLSGIKTLFSNLEVKEGDRVMIYFTGHGAQINDANNDEKDGKDEVFVCYDSPKLLHAEFSKKVLVDDSLHLMLTVLRKRLGKNGQVFMLAECCHSSTLDKGRLIPYKDYRDQWQSAFLSENTKTEGLAPMISFSASRASNMANIGYNFSTYFFTVLKNFRKGSYYDLFTTFYALQREKIFSDADIELTVNVHTEDPNYLRLGFLQDTTYAPYNRIRVTHTHNDYPTIPEIEINQGIFQGITLGTTVAIKPGSGQAISGEVIRTRNGSSDIRLKGIAPEKNSLWLSEVSISNYRFSDTLFLYFDKSLSAPITQQISDDIRSLNLVRKINSRTKGYTLFAASESEILLIRNEDQVALLSLKPEDVKPALIRMQINHFVKSISSVNDSTVQLLIYRNNQSTENEAVSHLRTGERIQLFVMPRQLTNDRYYSVLHIEDEFVRQLVPINFQINDGECKLRQDFTGKVYIGDVVIGKLPGRFLLITNDTPFDLREVLLSPEKVKLRNAKPELFNELEALVNKLFITKSDQSGLYHYSDIMKYELSYTVE